MNKVAVGLLALIATCALVIVLQNARLIPPIGDPQITPVMGTVAILDPVLNVNLAQVEGRKLVETERGMMIGVASADGKYVVPINWGSLRIEGGQVGISGGRVEIDGGRVEIEGTVKVRRDDY